VAAVAKPVLRPPGAVIAVDTSLLVYAHREDSAFHAAALAGLAQRDAAHALEQIDDWLERPRLVLLTEGDRHFDRFTMLRVVIPLPAR
jgi:hypothetical protein